MEDIILKVEGMSCSHCKAAVEKALKATPGVYEAVVDLSKKTVSISHDPVLADHGLLAKAINDAGYDVVG